MRSSLCKAAKPSQGGWMDGLRSMPREKAEGSLSSESRTSPIARGGLNQKNTSGPAQKLLQCCSLSSSPDICPTFTFIFKWGLLKTSLTDER